MAAYWWLNIQFPKTTCEIAWFNVPAGSYLVTAVLGQRVSDPVRVNVSTTPGAELPPAITSVTGTWSGADLVLTATVSDPDSTPVVKVDYYYIDTNEPHYLIGTATTSPYKVAWPSAGPIYGEIWAVATDSAGLATLTVLR